MKVKASETREKGGERERESKSVITSIRSQIHMRLDKTTPL